MALDAALRFTGAEKPRYQLALHVHHLAVRVGSQPRIGIVQTRCRPCRVERRLLDLVRRTRALEIAVGAGNDETVEALDRLTQRLSRHRTPLVDISLQLCGQLFKRGATEEIPAGAIDMRGFRRPFLARYCVGVEDRPDRTAA